MLYYTAVHVPVTGSKLLALDYNSLNQVINWDKFL